ncbi:helix-turn-helix domain-containing protein [Paraeggerthella sp. LCP19S3_G8]|uniref:helix-turn-helix domain-containing protein n=1 Tax=Paraeggerthella sp. LCP19S3_G8 TaxID=3440248 RepID=UPI002A86CDC1|nr:helix-turn-helix transcriptional regulator [Paraeggerthella sp.]
MYYEALDEAVTLYLKRASMTQDALAERMGMAPNTFSWKRRGIREFSLSEASRLADIVGISLDEATGRDERKAG